MRLIETVEAFNMLTGSEGTQGAPRPAPYDDVLRIAREALERIDRDARARADELVRQAEERARQITAEAESRATERAAEITRQAEERANVIPIPARGRLTGILREIDEASLLLGDARSRVESLLRMVDQAAAEAALGIGTSVRAPEPQRLPQPTTSGSPMHEGPLPIPPAPIPPVPPVPPRRAGAQTIVRGLRAQIMGGQVVPVRDDRSHWPNGSEPA